MQQSTVPDPIVTTKVLMDAETPCHSAVTIRIPPRPWSTKFLSTAVVPMAIRPSTDRLTWSSHGDHAVPPDVVQRTTFNKAVVQARQRLGFDTPADVDALLERMRQVVLGTDLVGHDEDSDTHKRTRLDVL